MSEKILQTKKNGMVVLLLILLGYIIAIAAAAAAGMAGVPGLESPLCTWSWPGSCCAGSRSSSPRRLWC